MCKAEFKKIYKSKKYKTRNCFENVDNLSRL